MTRICVAIGAVTALALSVWIGSAQAAPGGVALEYKSTLGETSNVEKAHRRCWWHRGHRHCRRYVRAYRYYDAPYFYGPRYYGFYGPSYYGLPYSYGYGPGIGLFFGGGHHHHHGNHGHGHRHH